MQKPFRSPLDRLMHTKRIQGVELHERTGIDMTLISRIRTGARKPTPEQARKLAKALKVTQKEIQ